LARPGREPQAGVKDDLGEGEKRVAKLLKVAGVIGGYSTSRLPFAVLVRAGY
jgi:hypothetical protein